MDEATPSEEPLAAGAAAAPDGDRPPDLEAGWDDDDAPVVVPISAVEHYSYCPRQCALIHVEQVFEENEFTVRGKLAHERVDRADDTPCAGSRCCAVCRCVRSAWACAAGPMWWRCARRGRTRWSTNCTTRWWCDGARTSGSAAIRGGSRSRGGG